jgi:hypothetical protein
VEYLRWDGITKAGIFSKDGDAARHALMDAAKTGRWEPVLERLGRERDLVNVVRPGGQAWYTPLHQAAYLGAPAGVVEQLIGLGAWRTLRTAQGERAVDIARRRGHTHLLPLLEPRLLRSVRADRLQAMQRHFHDVILTWAQSDDGRHQPVRQLVEQHQLRLPELEPLLEFEAAGMSFRVPGMFGGFSWRLEGEDYQAYLLVDSGSRQGDEGVRHLVSPHGRLLVGIDDTPTVQVVAGKSHGE